MSAPGSGWRNWLLKHLRRLLIFVLVSIPAVSIAIVLFEPQLMYWPSSVRVSPAESGLEGVTASTLATPDGERLTVWSAPPGRRRPTILYFHGNGGSLRYRAGRFAQYVEAGYGLYAIAYRGFHGSTGQPSERAIITDALLAFDALVARGVPPSDIVIYGESLGASVAVQIARQRPARAVVLEAPFTSMAAAWRQFVPLVPVGWLLRDQYRTIDVIARLTTPLLVLHGQRDRLVWFSQGRRLFEAATTRKRFEEFPDATHNNLYEHGAFARVDGFLGDLAAGRIQ